jgi:hypothetical protein
LSEVEQLFGRKLAVVWQPVDNPAVLFREMGVFTQKKSPVRRQKRTRGNKESSDAER